MNVSTQDETYSVDHVIFTGSLGVLKANHATLFTPPLSTRKQLAINVSYGQSIAKILFVCTYLFAASMVKKLSLETPP